MRSFEQVAHNFFWTISNNIPYYFLNFKTRLRVTSKRPFTLMYLLILLILFTYVWIEHNANGLNLVFKSYWFPRRNNTKWHKVHIPQCIVWWLINCVCRRRKTLWLFHYQFYSFFSSLRVALFKSKNVHFHSLILVVSTQRRNLKQTI